MIDASKTNIRKTRAAKHVLVSLRHPVGKRVGGARGINRRARGRSRALFQPGKCPRVSSSHIQILDRRRKKAQRRTRAERRKRRNAGRGAALEAQCATGTAADGFARVKECAAEPAAAAEGDALAGASTAERMRMLPGAWRCPGSSLLMASHIPRAPHSLSDTNTCLAAVFLMFVLLASIIPRSFYFC